jgi:hypothetical protein
MPPVDLAKLTPVESMAGEDVEETAQLRSLYEKAREFLLAFKWCGGIHKAYFGLGVADIVAVFLFEIAPRSKDVDSLLWVIVGDIPPAYTVTDFAPNAACALDGYIGLMTQWVEAVKSGKPVDDLIPVNGKPSLVNAEQLEKKLRFIDKEILCMYTEDLKAAPPA